MDVFTRREELLCISVYSVFTWKEKSQGISVDSTNDGNNCTTKKVNWKQTERQTDLLCEFLQRNTDLNYTLMISIATFTLSSCRANDWVAPGGVCAQPRESFPCEVSGKWSVAALGSGGDASLCLDMILASSASISVRIVIRKSSRTTRRAHFLCGRVRGHLARLEVKLVRGGWSWNASMRRSIPSVTIWRFGQVKFLVPVWWFVVFSFSLPSRTELGVVSWARVTWPRWRKVSLATRHVTSSHGPGEDCCGGGAGLHARALWPVEPKPVRRGEERWRHRVLRKLRVRHRDAAAGLGGGWPRAQGRLNVPLYPGLDSLGGRGPGAGAGPGATVPTVAVDPIHSAVRETLHLEISQTVNWGFIKNNFMIDWSHGRVLSGNARHGLVKCKVLETKLSIIIKFSDRSK